MTAGFDPAAATAAYLAQAPATFRAAAHARAAEADWSGVIGGVIAIAICGIILRSGALSGLRRIVEQDRPRPWLASLACAPAFCALFAVLILPWDVLLDWRQSLATAGSSFGFLGDALETLRGETAPLAAVSLVLTLLYALARRAPRTWWLWAGGGAAVIVLASVWLPYALASGPAGLSPVPPGPARDGLMRLVRDAGLPARDVYIEPGEAVDGDVTGTPFGARVVVTRPMLEQASTAEMRAAIGHLAGHFHYGDQLSIAVLLSLLILGGFYAAHRLFGPAARVMGARDAAGRADPAALPVMAAIGLVWLGVAAAGFNTFDRLINVRADQFSLDHAREPDGLARNLLRDWNGDDVDPPAVREALFYNHPSLKSRLLHAMTWKARHPG